MAAPPSNSDPTASAPALAIDALLAGRSLSDVKLGEMFSFIGEGHRLRKTGKLSWVAVDFDGSGKLKKRLINQPIVNEPDFTS